jgi:hypothetical protein
VMLGLLVVACFALFIHFERQRTHRSTVSGSLFEAPLLQQSSARAPSSSPLMVQGHSPSGEERRVPLYVHFDGGCDC